jgi:hypothetical protein
MARVGDRPQLWTGARMTRPVLPFSGSATFNGQPFTRFTGWYRNGDVAYDRDTVLELGFADGGMPPEARSASAAEFRLQDGDNVYSVTVPDAFTPRRMSFISPADGVLHTGQRVQLAWSPPSDGFSANVAIQVLADGEDPLRGGIVVHPEFSPGVIAFTMPSSLPGHGTAPTPRPARIQLLGTAGVNPATHCSVESCTVGLELAPADLATQIADGQ